MTDLIPGREPIPEATLIAWRNKKIPGRLAAARKYRGLSQQAAATALGMSISTLRRWETGRMRRPSFAYYVNAALLYKMPLTSLIEEQYLEWTVLDEDTPRGPNHDLWRHRANRPPAPPAP